MIPLVRYLDSGLAVDFGDVYPGEYFQCQFAVAWGPDDEEAFGTWDTVQCNAADIIEGASCRITSPTGPERMSIHLWGNFNYDKVVIELNSEFVFFGRVSTDHSVCIAEGKDYLLPVGLAGRIDFSLPEGAHRVRVIVNEQSSSVQEFIAGSIAAIGVEYNRVKRKVDLELLAERPVYVQGAERV